MILNLANEVRSDISFSINHFPDGQKSVTLTDEPPYSDTVCIKSRLNNFIDLEIILSATACLRNNGVKNISLYVPYFLGSRSDRRFGVGDCNYLKQVICPIINLQKYESVTVIDPHSDVLEACLDNFKKIDSFSIFGEIFKSLSSSFGDRLSFVSPDAGAYKKVYKVAKSIGINNILTANKVRDYNGDITKTEIWGINGDNNVYVIVDDICDGGRTFIELSKSIREKDKKSNINLVVTHGIFSNGLDQLESNIDFIFTTNSYSDIADSTSGKLIKIDVF